MAVRQHPTLGVGWPFSFSPPRRVLAPRSPNAAGEPDWLWESLRYQFWQVADLAQSIRRAGPFTPEQREAIAYWWSLLTAVERLGPRAYAAAFVRATEQPDSDQVRWSLLAMLRDELQHEQLCRLAMQRFAPGWPLQYQPQTSLGRHASQHLRQVDQEAERCWSVYQQALEQHGIGVVSGALLLGELVTGGLYERLASGCTIPVFATAFRHTGHDAQRHQAVLRALAARDWPLLSASQRSEAAAQVQAAARLLSAVMVGPAVQRPDLPGDPAANQPAWQAAACEAGLGIPSAEERHELLRTALLEVRDLQRRYEIPFLAMPQLAIPGSQEDTASGILRSMVKEPDSSPP